MLPSRSTRHDDPWGPQLLTPEEIASRQFLVSLRGYDRDEVAAFLQEVADEHAQLLERIEELDAALAEARRTAQGAERAPAAAAPSTAVEAQRPAQPVAMSPREAFAALGEETTRILVAAEESAQAIRDKAEERARVDLENSRREARDEVEGARRAASKIVADAERRRNTIAEDIRTLESTRDSFMQDLRGAMKGVQRAVRSMQTTSGTTQLAVDDDEDSERGQLAAPRPATPSALVSPPEPAGRTSEPPAPEPEAVEEDELEFLTQVLDEDDGDTPGTIEDAASAQVEADEDRTDEVTASAVAGSAATLGEDEIADVLGDGPGEAPTEADESELGAEPQPEPEAATPEPEPVVEESPTDPEAGTRESEPLVEEAPAPAPEAADIPEPPADEPSADEPSDDEPSGDEASADEDSAAPAPDADVTDGSEAAEPVVASAPTEPPTDIDPLALRDQSLAGVRPGMVRRLKRALQDVQNGVLDALRQAGDVPEVDDLLPRDEDLVPMTSVSQMFLTAAYRAGIADGGILAGREAGAEIADDAGDGSRVPAAATTFRAVLSHEITSALRATLRAGIEAGEPETSLSERVGEVFRDLKGPVVEHTVDQHLARVYGLGQIDIWKELGLGQSVWVAGVEPRCPANRCRVNEGEGPVALGAEFPSGDTVPPAHDGCTCGLAPA